LRFIDIASVVYKLVGSPRVWSIMGLSPGQIIPKTKIGISCYFDKHTARRSMSKDWLARSLGIRKMCQSEVTSLPADCCFCELALKNPTNRGGLVADIIISSEYTLFSQ
jgi:hypothetical protein